MNTENPKVNVSELDVRVETVKVKLDQVQHKKEQNEKDFWDKLGAASTLISGILVGLIGIYATGVYNARKLDSQRLQQEREISVRRVETVEKFFIHLSSENQSIRGAALDTIAALGDEELATNLARHFGGEGSRSTLARLSQSADPKIARSAELALNDLFSTLQKSVATFSTIDGRMMSSSFFVSSDGLLVVPSFSLGKDQTEFQVKLSSSQEAYPAKLVKKDDKILLALVKVDILGRTLPINKNKTKPVVGEQVAAVGFSGGIEWLSIVGRILGESSESNKHIILSDLKLSPGMAGAPVVNMAGELVGIAVASDRQRGVSHLVPSDVLWKFVNTDI